MKKDKPNVIDSTATPADGKSIKERMDERLKGKTPEEISAMWAEQIRAGMIHLSRLREALATAEVPADPADLADYLETQRGATLMLVDIMLGDFPTEEGEAKVS